MIEICGNDLQTYTTNIVVGGCGEYIIHDIPYIGLLAEIFEIRQANVAFVDLGPIKKEELQTIGELISQDGFTLQIDSVTFHPNTDLIKFIDFIDKQPACYFYLILINVLCYYPRIDPNILSSIASCNNLLGVMLADSYTPHVLFNRPPPIDDLLKSGFERIEHDQSIIKHVANIESLIIQSTENIYPYPDQTQIPEEGQSICFFDVFRRRK